MLRLTARQAERFVKEAGPHLFALKRTARLLTRRHHDADDLFQETIMRALRSLDQFEAGTDIQNWLATILMRIHIDTWRWARVRGTQRCIDADLALELADQAAGTGERVDPVDRSSTPCELLCRFDNEDVLNALRELPEALRSAVLLVDIAGLRHAMAARRLGVPCGTVASRCFYARQMLRHRLGSWAQKRGWCVEEPAIQPCSRIREKKRAEEKKEPAHDCRCRTRRTDSRQQTREKVCRKQLPANAHHGE